MKHIITRGLVLGCAAVAAMALGGPAQAEVKLSFAMHSTPPAPEFGAVDRFISLVENRSGGEIKVEVFHSASLGGERDNIEQLIVGEVAMTLNGEVLPSMIASDLAPTVVPFVFPSPEAVFNYWDSPMGQKLRDTISKRGITVAGLMRRGNRNLTANKPVKTPADMEGMKLRVPEIPSWVAAWSGTGANPTPVSWSEVFSALQTGVVDGQENPCFAIRSAKLYEVQDYLIMTQHLPAMWYWAISNKFLENLTPELRDIVLRSTAEAAAYGDGVSQEKIIAACKDLESKGMTIIEPDKQAFFAAAAPKIKELAKDWQPGVLDAAMSYQK